MNNRQHSRINYVPDLTRELLLQECPGIIKTMHTGLARTRITLYNARADTEETGRYDLAWKNLL